jgi:hypothetical protein
LIKRRKHYDESHKVSGVHWRMIHSEEEIAMKAISKWIALEQNRMIIDNQVSCHRINS